MSENFHTSWTATETLFKPSSMNVAMSYLDRGTTYLKNVIFHTDGDITYSIVSGILSWSSTIRILFNRDDGDIIQNTISTGSKSMTDREMLYVNLSEADGAALTMQKDLIALAATTPAIVTYNRLVLGYRNSKSDFMFNYFIKINPDNYTQEV